MELCGNSGHSHFSAFLYDSRHLVCVRVFYACSNCIFQIWILNVVNKMHCSRYKAQTESFEFISQLALAANRICIQSSTEISSAVTTPTKTICIALARGIVRNKRCSYSKKIRCDFEVDRRLSH